MNVKQQKAVGIGAAVALTMAAASFFLGVQPQLDSRTQTLGDVDQARVETGRLASQLVELEAKRDSLDQAEQEFAEIARQFPHDYEESAWLDLVYAAGRKAKVRVLSVSPSAPVDPSLIDAATGQMNAGAATTATTAAGESPIALSMVQIAANGTPEDLTRFLAALENLERPLLISGVDISGEGEQVGLTVRGSLFLTRPMPRPGETPPAVAAPDATPAPAPDAAPTATP